MFTGIPAAAQPGGRAVSWGLRILVVVGLAAIVLSWAETSDTVIVSRQVDWAPVGLAGVSVVVLALLGSVLVARQAVGLRLARLAPSVATPAARAAGVAAPAAPPATVPAGAETLVAGLNMVRYHRPSCPLAAGKSVWPDNRRAHEQAGRRACGVCAP